MSTRRSLFRRPRGQAMAEYSSISFLLIVAIIISANVRLLPAGPERRNLVEMMMLAFQNYLDAYYYILSLPIP